MNIESMTSRKQVKTEKKREVGEGLGEREGRGGVRDGAGGQTEHKLECRK